VGESTLCWPERCSGSPTQRQSRRRQAVKRVAAEAKVISTRRHRSLPRGLQTIVLLSTTVHAWYSTRFGVVGIGRATSVAHTARIVNPGPSSARMSSASDVAIASPRRRTPVAMHASMVAAPGVVRRKLPAARARRSSTVSIEHALSRRATRASLASPRQSHARMRL
jgi:hypothetical protein